MNVGDLVIFALCRGWRDDTPNKERVGIITNIYDGIYNLPEEKKYMVLFPHMEEELKLFDYEIEKVDSELDLRY
jgi:hypothetical protein|tara:strand:+ start:3026 stop:3247 length:222 start_codon:yes stop_codon:yes gene_type:complete